jgi:hypothetical protein
MDESKSLGRAGGQTRASRKPRTRTDGQQQSRKTFSKKQKKYHFKVDMFMWCTHVMPVSPDTCTSAATILLAFFIVWILKRSLRGQKSNSFNPLVKTAHPTEAPRENGNLLIIDGCNGPIRFNKLSSTRESPHILEDYQISFLRVVNGVNRDERMELLPKIEQALRRLTCFNRAVIYFDGLGMKSIENVQRDITPWIKLEVTDRNQEVDDAIVDLVVKRNSGKGDDNNREALINVFNSLDDAGSLDDAILHLRKTPNATSLTSTSTIASENESMKLPMHSCQDYNVYTVTRNDQGSGKSRGLLKPLCLLRPSSVFCLFGSSFMPPLHEKSKFNLKQLSTTSAKKLVDKVEMRALNAHNESIVVTDDIFLRQRIVDAGGFVMTFEQLWVLLDKI